MVFCALSVHEIGYISTFVALLQRAMLQPAGCNVPDIQCEGAERPEPLLYRSGWWRKIADGPLEET